jgi:hypothetical protein
MASNINDTGVNQNYPVAGVDNDSQGFRDNFSVIRSNFVAAKAEIQALQNTTAQGVTYNSETGTNDFLNSTVTGVNLINSTEQSYSAPGTVTSSQNVNLSSGFYQSFTVGADITFNLTEWNTDAGKTGRVRIYIKNDSVQRTITFQSNENAGTIKRGPSWPTADNTAVIDVPNTKTFVFEFVSFDSGATVYAEYLGVFQ